MQKMTNVVSMLKNMQGASFVGLDTRTGVQLRGGKKNPMQGRVTKLSEGNSVMLFQNKNGSSYGAMVERRLKQEGKDPASFTLQPRTWGERIPNMPIIQHTVDGEVKHYLEVIFLRPGVSHYFLDGLPIAKEDIEGLAPPTIRDDAQGGLENMVIVRTFALDSLVQVRIDQMNVVGPFYFKG